MSRLLLILLLGLYTWPAWAVAVFNGRTFIYALAILWTAQGAFLTLCYLRAWLR